jgi:DNA invertase Pin-like site-specific DNA recombinase
VSRGKDSREGLNNARTALQSGDLVVVKAQDRLGRRFASLALIEELEDRGVRMYLAGSRRFAAVDLLTGVEARSPLRSG